MTCPAWLALLAALALAGAGCLSKPDVRGDVDGGPDAGPDAGVDACTTAARPAPVEPATHTGGPGQPPLRHDLISDRRQFFTVGDLTRCDQAACAQ